MENNSQPLVSIIILNYNAGDFLMECISSVLKTEYSNFEVIVIDNASKDGSIKKCKEQFKNVSIIENKNNLGYCEGNNVGIREARGSFVVILNPDTIVKPDWIDELLKAFKKYGDGLYQPKILSIENDNILGNAGSYIQLFGFGYAKGYGERDSEQYDTENSPVYASGTCLFSKKSTFEKLGMFDPFLFAYHDDLDLGWRANLEGINSWYVPKSIVYHKLGGYSFGWSRSKFFLLERNRIYCLLTHYSHKTFIKMLPALILVDFAVILFYLKKGMIREKAQVTISILKNLKKINQRYAYIQKRRKFNDSVIIKKFRDEIFTPPSVLDKETNKFLNTFIGGLSKLTRFFI